MSTIDKRREQMFPKLEPRENDRLRRFGDVRRYSAGEALFVTGEIAPGMAVLIKGSVRVTRRDPLGHRAPIVEQGAGEFVAEVGQLSGQPAFVDVHAIDDVEALLIPSENLRALVIEEPELGERIMRALILRRVALAFCIQTDFLRACYGNRNRQAIASEQAFTGCQTLGPEFPSEAGTGISLRTGN